MARRSIGIGMSIGIYLDMSGTIGSASVGAGRLCGAHIRITALPSVAAAR
jgi:hypothetical protein